MRALTMQQWNSICDGVFSGYVFKVYLRMIFLEEFKKKKKWTWTKERSVLPWEERDREWQRLLEEMTDGWGGLMSLFDMQGLRNLKQI